MIVVVAYDRNRLIGKQGELPWCIKEDMVHFKKLTWGGTVIMGRRTWDSLPLKFRPLAGRLNIVLTSKLDDSIIHSASSLEGAADVANRFNPGAPIFVIGGAMVYSQALQDGRVHQIIASEVKGDYKGDVYFPDIGSGWQRRVVAEYDQFSVVEYVREGEK